MPFALRVLSLGLALVGLATCHAPSTPRTTAPLEVAPEVVTVAARRFDPDVVRSAPGSARADSLAALREGRHDAAIALTQHNLSDADADEAPLLAWIAAAAHVEAGAPGRAVELLESLASSEHPLAPWARLARARAMLTLDAAAAAREAAPLTELTWAGRGEARELHAAALVASGALDEAEPLLRALLLEGPEDAARAAVAMPLAELLAAREDEAARLEALALYRRVASRAPLSAAGREAEARAAVVLAALPAERRRALAEPSPEDALARARALASAMRHEEAAEAFAAVAARTEDEALGCVARLGEGRALYDGRERARAAALLVEVAAACEADDVRAWARYLAGRGFTGAGQNPLAIAQYALLEREVPTHTLADDARYRSALLAREAGDEDALVSRLATLPELYPAGDMRGDARFTLAWQARRRGDHAEALRQLDLSLAEGPQEDREDLPGRAAYWRAVVLVELGRRREALEGFREVVRTAPLRYHGQQALVRLRELDPAAERAARATLGAPGGREITFAWRDELDTPAFTRALALLKVGALDAAERELAAVRAESGAADDELRWIEAALLDRAGAHPEAVNLTRRTLAAFMDQAPDGAHAARWRIAYPRAYATEIEAAAADRPLPANLVFAIAREESSFRPDAVSVAHAYGLTQLILPTAQRFGRRVGLRPTARTLTDPATNVQIGAEYLSWLWDRYEANPVVLASAYNAGQGATDRWLRERPRQRLDEWIEEIPYDETRRYTRRVVQSWGIYAWLDGAELPTLAPALPQR